MKPTRSIAGQATLLGRTMHAIQYDEIHDELVVPQLFGQAILTFRGGASGEEAPIRVIRGPSTTLQAPERVAVDPVNNEIFVSDRDGSVKVFPREGQGDVAPLRTLRPDPLEGESMLAVDPVHNLLIMASRGTGEGSLLQIFNRTDEGTVKPKAVIRGPKTGLVGAQNVQVYPPRGEIIMAVPGGGRSSGTGESHPAFVGVWSIHDSGDVPPRWTIGGPNGMLRNPRGVALDPKHKTVMVSDKHLNAVLTYYFPEIF